MPVRSDVLWHITLVNDSVHTIVVPSDERWIIKNWTFWADTNVIHTATRYIFSIFPPHGVGVAVLYDSADPTDAHDLVTNGRRDRLAVQPWEIAEAGATLQWEAGIGALGTFHLYVAGTRLAL